MQVTFGLHGVKTKCLSYTELTGRISSLTVFEPNSAVQGEVEVLLGLQDKVVKLNSDGLQNTVFHSTPGKPLCHETILVDFIANEHLQPIHIHLTNKVMHQGPL